VKDGAYPQVVSSFDVLPLFVQWVVMVYGSSIAVPYFWRYPLGLIGVAAEKSHSFFTHCCISVIASFYHESSPLALAELSFHLRR
jgi:hypothetical protein